MKFYLSLIALIFVSLFITTGFSPSSSEISVGDVAPQFSVSNSDGSFSLRDSRGDSILITFWSVSDAASRRDCNIYSASLDGTGVRHIAINLDVNSPLYSKVVLADGLPAADCYSPDALTASQIARNYGLEGRFGSVLVSPDGKISSINPDPECFR